MQAIILVSRKNTRGLSSLGFCLILSALMSCGKNNASTQGGTGPADVNLVDYTGTFVNASAPDSSKATGTVMATFNTTTLELTYTINWNSLTSNPLQMHFHDDGPVIVKITGYPVATTGFVSGTCTFNSAQGGDLASGRIYAMIHTQSYTAGEIMATLVKK